MSIININKIEAAKDRLNIWANDWFANVARLLIDVADGDATPEEIAVLNCGSFEDDFGGWGFQLPKTIKVINYLITNPEPTPEIKFISTWGNDIYHGRDMVEIWTDIKHPSGKLKKLMLDCVSFG